MIKYKKKYIYKIGVKNVNLLYNTFMRKISVYVIFLTFVISSCNSTRNSIYFRDLGDMNIQSDIQVEAPVIKKNDLISISVSSLNPTASELFNNSISKTSNTSTVSGTINQSFGYLIDVEGNFQFPILGEIKAEGLTTKALEDTIKAHLLVKKLLIDPIVTVRYLNFKISVMGEVDKPSVYNIPNEKITVLEALALAGDMTIYAKRNNVLLIREENGEKKLVRLDMSGSDIFYSEYYYLKSNDIIYVEPRRSKVATTRPLGTYLSAVFSGTSLLISLILIFK